MAAPVNENGSPLGEPAYSVRALAEGVPAVASALGSPLGSVPSDLELPSAQGYVVLLIDGLGQQLLQRYAHAAPYLSELTSRPGTAGVPSTQAPYLTSLGPGLPPGQHGLVRFTPRIPGPDRLPNTRTSGG